MDIRITTIPVTRVDDDGTSRVFDDEVAVEVRFRLVLNGTTLEEAVVSPVDLREWAAGHLLCTKMITGLSGIKGIEVSGEEIRVSTEPFHEERRSFPVPSWQVSPATIHDGARWIAEAPLFLRTGGFHAAAMLSVEGERLARFEDISRHNAMDKAIGWGLLSKVDMGRTMIVQSGRLPGDMVAKAVAAGIPLLASVSAPTSEGIKLAREKGITLAGFVREQRMNVYSFRERIKTDSS